MADPVTIAILATATASWIGIGYGVSKLRSNSDSDAPNANAITDDNPTPRSKRGSHIPIVIGRRIIPPVVCWTGDRREVSESAGGGGGGKGGGAEIPEAEIITFKEDAMHALCIGPVYAIRSIRPQGGRSILGVKFSKRTTREEIASGDAVNIKRGGFAKISWGDCDTPPNTLWSGNVKEVDTPIESSWPNIAYVYLNGFELGQQPVWPALQYEVETRWTSCLSQSEAWLNETANDRRDDGVNPAHALVALMTGTYPHGSGLLPIRMDQDKFEALGKLAQEEHIPINIVAQDGIEAIQMIRRILNDYGVALSQLGRQIVPVPLREEDESSLPTLDDDVVMGELPERTHELVTTRRSRLAFEFQDNKNFFRTQSLQWDADEVADARKAVDLVKVDLQTLTSEPVVHKSLDRLYKVHSSDPQRLRYALNRGGRLMSPGQGFKVPGFGVLRCAGLTIKPADPSVKIDSAVDQYNQALTGYEADCGVNREDLQPTPDFYFQFTEVPYIDVRDNVRIRIARWRALSEGLKAVRSQSTNNSTYLNEGLIGDVAGGGFLLDPISEDDLYVMEEGPRFDPRDINQASFPSIIDNDRISDFTGNESVWRSGRQRVLINGELFYMRNITILSSTEYRMDGLIRARADTLPEAHAVNDRVIIFWDIKFFEPYRESYITPGALIFLKTLPGLRGDFVDAADVTPFSATIKGRALKGLRVSNFRANRDVFSLNEYETGEDVLFEWSYRVRDGGGAAAGEALTDDPITTVPEPDGPGILVILTSGDVEVNRFNLTKAQVQTQSFNYTNAQLQIDFSGEPASLKAQFIQEVEDPQNGVTNFPSDPVEITITKV